MVVSSPSGPGAPKWRRLLWSGKLLVGGWGGGCKNDPTYESSQHLPDALQTLQTAVGSFLFPPPTPTSANRLVTLGDGNGSGPTLACIFPS